MEGFGFIFKRVLSDDEQNAMTRVLCDSIGLHLEVPDGDVDVEVLLREAKHFVLNGADLLTIKESE